MEESEKRQRQAIAVAILDSALTKERISRAWVTGLLQALAAQEGVDANAAYHVAAAAVPDAPPWEEVAPSVAAS